MAATALCSWAIYDRREPREVATAGLVAVFVLNFWWELRVVERGLVKLSEDPKRDSRGFSELVASFGLTRLGILIYPVATFATMIAVTSSLIVLTAGPAVLTFPLLVGSLWGGVALRLVVGVALLLLVMPQLPEDMRDQITDALRTVTPRR